MQLRHFYAKKIQKANFPCYGRNSRSDVVIIFWATSVSLVCVDTLGLKGKDVHLNWQEVLEPGFDFVRLLSQKKTYIMEKHQLLTS